MPFEGFNRYHSPFFYPSVESFLYGLLNFYLQTRYTMFALWSSFKTLPPPSSSTSTSSVSCCSGSASCSSSNKKTQKNPRAITSHTQVIMQIKCIQQIFTRLSKFTLLCLFPAKKGNRNTSCLCLMFTCKQH